MILFNTYWVYVNVIGGWVKTKENKLFITNNRFINLSKCECGKIDFIFLCK